MAYERWTGTAEMEALFDRSAEAEDTRSGDVMAVRTRETVAGPQMDVEIFPVWDTRGTEAAKLRAKTEKHRQAVAAVNERRLREKVRRLVLVNFVPGDLFLTLTYEKRDESYSLEGVRDDIKNYVAKLKRARKRAGLTELKYLYVIERNTIKKTHTDVYHVHIFLNAMDRETAEGAWPHGFANSKALREDESQDRFARICKYVCKSLYSWEKYERAWGKSRNLAKPEERESERRFSRTALRRAMKGIEEDESRKGLQALAERKYPEYEVLRIEAHGSRYVPGVYIYIRMRRRTGDGLLRRFASRNDRGGGNGIE